MGSGILNQITSGAAILSSIPQRPSRTAEEEIQSQVEYLAYKKRCEQKPDDNLSRCATAIFQKNRQEDCLRMRQEWDNRWWPGRHDDEIKNVRNGLKNAIKDVKNRCKPTSDTPREDR